MKLTINGQEQEFAGVMSLSALVEQLGMKQDRVAVELNRKIVQRENWNQTALTDGDRLEIVHFVGGGSSELFGRNTIGADVWPQYFRN